MTEVSLLQEIWTEYRADIDTALESYLDLGPNCPDKLREAMHYSLMAGGKRLRPILVLLACEACGGKAVDALPAACAIEMIHTYSLIHDDLPAMDDDDLRRGKPTNHKQFGEALAILAGDALLTLAFQIMAQDVQPQEVAAACCADLAAAAGATGMVAGQVVDLEAEDSGIKDVQHLEGIHRRKTGRLLSCALSLGARIAGADWEMRNHLVEYGKSVGLAFQIADDLLDISGDSEIIGKQTQKDADHGKLTYPSLLGVEESRDKAKQLIQDAHERLKPLGERGQRLAALADFIIARDH
ncbi:MAG: polyprenyl synthetase family protein [Planctomycetaceae bacterium]|nr:polyprenyl synthetase family protein [Planctomycetaceae bacterium]